jgi:hypothetical protein
MTPAQNIANLILTTELTASDLSTIVEAIKYVRARDARFKTRTLLAGDQVKFTDSRYGREIQGTVKKVAIKNVVVDTALGAYRVPANMLTVV